MQKKTTIKIILVFVLGLMAYLTYQILIKSSEKNIVEKKLQNLPSFEFVTVNKTRFTNASLKPNLNTVFIYFNSECDYCQHEAQNISENLGKLGKAQFVFVSDEPIEEIKRFSENHKLNSKPNITFLHDSHSIFSNQFGASSVPYILIYDKKQKLVKKHNGQLNANGILRALNEYE